ncbi:hypothetical protein FJR38_27345 [Anabaena sp. UHCC 0253]|uniref:hypothetical protein n=1 Tax=Anabaena sp. UHCC 0253 TaxID=2590019 RepID=UPI0014463443|nr:hypothetical protein [Anabaena sp. UHCC 0253]MTJ56096.1 hypothetical protein [Anabaena sp. UHCC 0253]
MSNKIGLTNDEINRAIELLKKAGHPGLSSSIAGNFQTQLYSDVLKAEEKMLEEIGNIYKKWEEYAEWRREDLKEDKEIAKRVRASMGLED